MQQLCLLRCQQCEDNMDDVNDVDDVNVIYSIGNGGSNGTFILPSGNSAVGAVQSGTCVGQSMAGNSGWITIDDGMSTTYVTSSRDTSFPYTLAPQEGATLLKITDIHGTTREINISNCTVSIEREDKIALTPEENYNLAMKIIG